MSINCDPSSLANAARCISSCIPQGAQAAVQNFLLCNLAQLTEQKFLADTANPDLLYNFWKKANTGTTSLRVLGLGDSVMQDDHGGKTYGFMIPLAYELNKRRNGGITSFFPWLMDTGAAGATLIPHDANWPVDHYTLPAGGTIVYDSNLGNRRVFSDKTAVYYLQTPGAGSFKISISTNGGAYVDLVTINANGATAGVAAQQTFAIDQHTMKITGVAGTVTIFGAGLWDDSQFNLAASQIVMPGLALSDWNNIPNAIKNPILTYWAPDLILTEWKDSEAGIAASLPIFDANLKAAVPNCDVIYIGTTPHQDDGINQTITIPQNTTMRSFALANNRMYWDSYYIWPSWAYANALGFVLDSGHFNLLGATVMGGLLWDEVFSKMKGAAGLELPRIQRSVKLTQTGRAHVVTDANLAPDNDLVCFAEAQKTYLIRGGVFFNCADDTTGFSFAFEGPNNIGPSLSTMCANAVFNNRTTFQQVALYFGGWNTNGTANVIAAPGGAAKSSTTVLFTCIYKTNLAGIFRVWWAAGSDSATQLFVREGSFLEVEEIGR